MNRIVSVVVPTKNRYKYLKVLIELIESYKNEEIELVIQDNSDNNEEIVEFLRNRDLTSTVYHYCADKLSMSDNADLGIKNSTGKYVCFIGDDDAVCRTIVDCAHWMEDNGIDAVRSLEIHYIWNDYNKSDKKSGKGEGKVSYDANVNLAYKLLDPKKELTKVLKRGVQAFWNLPKVYQGIVSRKVLDQLFELGGTCFPGVTPDMSSSVSLCFYVEKFALISIPVVLPGRSVMVGGGVMGKVLTLDEVTFISDEHRQNWEKDFPKLWATELIWPDCAMKALRYVNHEEYIRKYFNKYVMLSRLVFIHKSYYNEAWKYANNKILYIINFIKCYFETGLLYIWNNIITKKITGKYAGRLDVRRGLSIIEAEKYLVSLAPNDTFNHLSLKQVSE